jgi:uncharacterized protein (TIGR03086 family)
MHHMNQPLAPTDPRLTIAEAVRVATTTIAAVTPDQLTSPTPCDDYDTRALLGHLVMVLRRIEAVGNGLNPMTVSEQTTVVDDDAWLDTWTEAAHRVQVAWTDAAKLDQEVMFPWATLPGSAALLMYTSEVSVHTWDLAQATGQSPEWDDEVLAAAYGFMQMALPGDDREASFEAAREHMPEHMRDFPPPFRNVVPTPDDAPLINKLVAWNGRQPS